MKGGEGGGREGGEEGDGRREGEGEGVRMGAEKREVARTYLVGVADMSLCSKIL